jgi:amino acid transporter
MTLNVNNPAPAPAATGTTPPPPSGARLARVLGVFGGVMLTLSCITPASSLFILVPPMLADLGTGAPLTLVAAALVSVGVGLCYAELGTLMPSSGGEYAMIGAMLGRAASWLVFALTITMIVIIPPVIALGTADYLAAVIDVDRGVAGAGVMLLATLIALLDVRSNAFVTGLFLVVEIVAAAVVAVLGFAHTERSASTMLDPVVAAGSGALTPFALSTLLTGLAVAMFTFNGFGSAVYLAEEMHNPRRTVAHTVLWSLVAGVAIILIPTIAVILGAPDLATLAHANFTALVEGWAGPTVAAFVSLGIAGAILNAVIVMVLQNARVLFASGRDRAWPAPINRGLTRLHPRWRSPWLSTLVVGVPGAVLAAAVDIEALIGLTGAVVAVVYLLLAVATLRSRSGRVTGRAWRMPAWPLPAVAVIVAIAFALFQQATIDLVLTAAVCGAAMLYYLAYLRPRGHDRWRLTTPTEDEAHGPDGHVQAPAGPPPGGARP